MTRLGTLSWIAALAMAAKVLAQDPIDLKTNDAGGTPQIRVALNSGATPTYVQIQNARLQLGTSGYLNLAGSAAAAPSAGDVYYSGGNVLYYNGSSWQTFATTSGSNSAVLLAPASAQTDSSTNSSVFVNKTGLSGNLMELQVSGSDKFVVNYSGTVTTGTWNGAAIGVAYGGTGTSTAFTAGSVVFAGASGVYSQNNSKFFWDNTIFRLGLGTAAPAAPLHVISTGDVAHELFETSSTLNKRVRIDFAQTGTQYIELGTDYSLANTADFYIYNRATGLTAAYFNPGGNVWFNPTGNIGVKNTSPSYPLDVTGQAHITSNLGVGITPISSALVYGSESGTTAGTNWLSSTSYSAIYGDSTGAAATEDWHAAIIGSKAADTTSNPDGGVVGFRYSGATVLTLGGLAMKIDASNLAGCYGNNANTATNNYGCYGSATGAGTNNLGVYGTASGGSSANYGVYGTVATTTGSVAGVIGFSTGATGNTFGVYGTNASSGGGSAGTIGLSSNASGTGTWGENTTAAGAGIGLGMFARTAQSAGLAVWCVNTNATGVALQANGSNTGVLFANGEGVSASGVNYGVLSRATGTGATYGGYFDNGPGWYCYIGGNGYKIVGNGTVSTIVQDVNGNQVTLHCPEAPEVIFQDFGMTTLAGGRVHVTIDPSLAKNIVVDRNHPLRVYAQPYGDCKGVFVDNATAQGFDIVESGGGTSNVGVAWQIAANRADSKNPPMAFSTMRFEPAPGPLTPVVREQPPAFQGMSQPFVGAPRGPVQTRN